MLGSRDSGDVFIVRMKGGRGQWGQRSGLPRAVHGLNWMGQNNDAVLNWCQWRQAACHSIPAHALGVCCLLACVLKQGTDHRGSKGHFDLEELSLSEESLSYITPGLSEVDPR